MLNIPEELPEAMQDFIIESEAEGFIPSADEFEASFAEHPEHDYWQDVLQLPELRQELGEEMDDEIFQKPLTLRQEYASRGLKLTDFY